MHYEAMQQSLAAEQNARFADGYAALSREVARLRAELDALKARLAAETPTRKGK